MNKRNWFFDGEKHFDKQRRALFEESIEKDIRRANRMRRIEDALKLGVIFKRELETYQQGKRLRRAA